jgi:endonuclease YncB( thermonuclease family)
MRRLLGVLLILPFAAPAAAQTVGEVRATDTLLIENVGEVKLLGVEAIGSPTATAKESRCAASAKTLVQQLAFAKEVRLVKDANIGYRKQLASHYYVYLPDGRLLNQLVLESGCARPKAYVSDLTLATPLQTAALQAQMANRGLYGLDDEARPAAPTRPEEFYKKPPVLVLGPPAYFNQPPERRATLERYNRIRIGATYDEVMSIFGAHGKQIRSTTTASGTRMVVEWVGVYGEGCATVDFKNGVVESKTNVGLR